MDGLFAFQVGHLRTSEDILHTVYFPLTKGLAHTIKMFYLYTDWIDPLFLKSHMSLTIFNPGVECLLGNRLKTAI